MIEWGFIFAGLIFGTLSLFAFSILPLILVEYYAGLSRNKKCDMSSGYFIVSIAGCVLLLIGTSLSLLAFV
jgi:hypothetical protein